MGTAVAHGVRDLRKHCEPCAWAASRRLAPHCASEPPDHGLRRLNLVPSLPNPGRGQTGTAVDRAWQADAGRAKRMEMAIYAEGKGIAVEAEPFGPLTEGAAGIAAIVLAGISTGALASITTIIIGVALMAQAFNAAAEASRELNASGTATTVAARGGEFGGGEVMILIVASLTGIVLGILGLVGFNAPHLIPAALIVFGGSLVLSGAIAAQGRVLATTMTASGAPVQVGYQGSAGMSGLEIMVGFAAVLGILSLIFESSWVLVLVGFIAVGAALMIVSATFSGAVTRLFTTATA